MAASQRASSAATASIGICTGSPPCAAIAAHRSSARPLGRVIKIALPLSPISRLAIHVSLAIDLSLLAIHLFENFGGTLAQQLLSERNAERFRIAAGGAHFRAQNDAAIAGADQAAQKQLIALAFGETGDRHLATALQMTIHGALGAYAQRCGFMIQRLQQRPHPRVVHANFDSNRSLPPRRQAPFGGDALADALAEIEAQQSRRGEDDGVVIAGIEFGETRIDVAAQAEYLEIGPIRGQLTLPAQARSADPGPQRQLVDR